MVAWADVNALQRHLQQPLARKGSGQSACIFKPHT